MSNTNQKVQLKTQPSKITEKGEFWVVDMPRFGPEGTHHHTLGMLTPYFKALTEGRLLATRCTNAKCPIGHGKGDMWLPPRADCPDCHQPMVWEEIKNPVGEIYAFTFVERGGQGLEIECPYYQVDVLMEGVGTIIKGYLINRDRKIKRCDKVKAGFLTGAKATNTCLDIYWELV